MGKKALGSRLYMRGDFSDMARKFCGSEEGQK